MVWVKLKRSNIKMSKHFSNDISGGLIISSYAPPMQPYAARLFVSLNLLIAFLVYSRTSLDAV